MDWIYLLLAGIFEFGWPIGFKLAQTPDNRITGILISVSCMICSGFLLYLAQRSIPMGTAYAVWTGIGAVGTFLIGVVFFKDPGTFTNFFGIALIISGLALLKIG